MAQVNGKKLVMKFGGTSVGIGMPQSLEIVQKEVKEWDNVVVVTSALTQVTNKLLASAQNACTGDTQTCKENKIAIRAQHLKVCEEQLQLPAEETEKAMLVVDKHLSTLESLCTAMAVLGEFSPRGNDAVASLGERMSIVVLAAALRNVGIPAEAVDAAECVVTDCNFQDAHPDMAASVIKTQARLGPLLEQGIVPVVTGFVGATPEGITTTLGRGGSDFSATIIGNCIDAAAVWIWTDVNGIMTADPRIAKDAVTIPRLSLREVAEMSYFGAKVVHPKTVRPVVEKGIPVRICNTFNAAHPGTTIHGDGTGVSRIMSCERLSDLDATACKKKGYKAVTSIEGCRLITLAGRGMLGVLGVAARLFTAVSDTNTSVLLITQASSEQSICIAVPSKSAQGVVDALEGAFKKDLELGDIDSVTCSEECSILTVVGAEMVHTHGIAGLVFTALGECNVNVMAIAQGSSEVSISAVVSAEDTKKAVVALHGGTSVTPHQSPLATAQVSGTQPSPIGL